MSSLKLLAISDFNIGNLAALLSNDPAAPAVEAREAPFGQPHQLLADASHPAWSEPLDCLVAWTLPYRAVSAFARAREREPVDAEEVLAEVDAFAALIRSASARARVTLVPNWTLPPWERQLGMLDLQPGRGGVRDLLGRMNLRLAEALADGGETSAEGGAIYVLDAQRWAAAAGARAFSPKAWYLGKIPFGNEVFKLAAADIKASLRAVAGQARKLVVVDLDDTLWGGVVGDAGWENLALGGHDGEGEALADFQRTLKALTRRGVLLGIASKNEESTALEAIRSHPEMILKTEDFAGWRINWNDKAQNVADLAAELNLGLQSVVFIDDNPAERARVREALPEVLVPEWPKDKTLYPKALMELDCFDVPALTDEDRKRAAMYVSERQRRQARQSVGSLDDWLATLEVEIAAERLSEANLARAAQLLNKTNQMNLATRRMTESELRDWAAEPGRGTWTFKVKDKFGDLGLTGLLSLELDEASGAARVADFLLSCRVMGRKVEETMLAVAVGRARQCGAERLEAVFQPTEKNKPCLDFLKDRSGLEQIGESPLAFAWKLQTPYPVPSQVTLAANGMDDR